MAWNTAATRALGTFSAMSERPIVGITSYAQPAKWGAWELPAALVPLYYVDSVELAGGRALLVPPSEHAIDETLDVLDGLVFSGGIDIDPTRYGADRHPATDPAQAHRDAGELALSRPRSSATCRRWRSAAASSCSTSSAEATSCSTSRRRSATTGHRETLGVFSEHPVDVKEGTRLASILGARHESVRSSHHQGVGKVGEGLVETRVGGGRRARGTRGPSRSDSPSGCCGTPRWRRTTSVSSRRSSTRRAPLPRRARSSIGSRADVPAVAGRDGRIGSLGVAPAPHSSFRHSPPRTRTHRRGNAAGRRRALASQYSSPEACALHAQACHRRAGLPLELAAPIARMRATATDLHLLTCVAPRCSPPSRVETCGPQPRCRGDSRRSTRGYALCSERRAAVELQ